MNPFVKLNLAVPTRERPGNAVRLAKQIAQTCNSRVTVLEFIIDHDDPAKHEYLERMYREAPWAEVIVLPPSGPQRLGPILNYHAVLAADSFDFIAFMGDDHYPRTPLWDEKLCWSLRGRPGVAYGDDMYQRDRLPTACVIDARIIRVLGYMVPEPLVHLCLDDWWKRLGQDLGNLVYLPGVVIEHLHAVLGKAPMDRVYAESGMNAELERDDRWRWEQWREHVWPSELERLKDGLAQAGPKAMEEHR